MIQQGTAAKMLTSAQYFWCWEMGLTAREAVEMVKRADFDAIKSWAILGSVLSQKKFKAMGAWIQDYERRKRNNV